MTYADKLKDPRWQKRRVEVMQRDGFKCRQCGAADKTLAIHHLAYGRGEEPWESPAEVLLTVCEGCHDRWRAFADWCSRLQVIVRDAEMEPEAAQQIIAGALQNDGSRKMNPACLGEMLSTQEGAIALDALAACWASAHFRGYMACADSTKKAGQ